MGKGGYALGGWGGLLGGIDADFLGKKNALLQNDFPFSNLRVIHWSMPTGSNWPPRPLALVVSMAIMVVGPSAYGKSLRLATHEIVRIDGPEETTISVYPGVIEASGRLRQMLSETPSLKGKIRYRPLSEPHLQVLDDELHPIQKIPLSPPGDAKFVDPILFQSTETSKLHVARTAEVSAEGQHAVLIERRYEPDGGHGEATGAIGYLDNTAGLLWQEQLSRNMTFADVAISGDGRRVFALAAWTIATDKPTEQLRVFDRSGDAVFSFPTPDEKRYRFSNLCVSKNGKFVGLRGQFESKSILLFFDVADRQQWSMPWSGNLGEIDDSGVYRHIETWIGPSLPRTIDLTQRLTPMEPLK